jgi:uncharacterized protein (DUF2141 family)
VIPSLLRLSLSLLLLGCAKVGAPAGGPLDKLPPAIAAHSPAADAVGVPLDSQVELSFSESMERTRTEAALFLSPSAPFEPSWQGRRLRLRFPQGLKPDQTYVITLGTGARDLRGNALAQSFTLAFATGAQLNQGRIEGRVFSRHQPAGSAYVWAYGPQPGGQKLLTDLPDYRTQTSSDGRYTFSRLPPGAYRLVAFADADADQRWDQSETLALPAGDLDLKEGAALRAGDLDLFALAGLPPHLQRIQALDQQRLLLLFDREVSLEQTTLEVEGLATELLYQLPADRRKVYARTAPQEAGRPYTIARLETAGQPLKWREPLRGNGRPDQTPPALASTPTAGILSPQDSLVLVFSEAMEAADPGELWLASDSTQTPAGRWLWQAPAVLAFVPQLPWAPGVHRLQGRTGALRDLAGLAPRDSLFTLSFSVPEQLCRLAGQVLSPSGTPIRAWVSAKSAERSWQAQTDAQGRFLFADLVPGTYRVFAFADPNLNQQQDRGTLEPFLPSEPYACLPEAITLAASAVRDGLELHLGAP